MVIEDGTHAAEARFLHFDLLAAEAVLIIPVVHAPQVLFAYHVDAGQTLDRIAQHRDVEDVLDVVVRPFVGVEIIRHARSGAALEGQMGKRSPVHAPDHPLDLPRAQRHFQVAPLLVRGTAFDGEVDGLPPRELLDIGRIEVLHHRGADDHGVVLQAARDARVHLALLCLQVDAGRVGTNARKRIDGIVETGQQGDGRGRHD